MGRRTDHPSLFVVLSASPGSVHVLFDVGGYYE